MNKIKTLIVNDNEKVINEIKEALSPIEYVEVVGECKKGEETFEKVVELKPNAVFVKYGMKGYNPIDVMIKSSKILGKETPMFKFVSNELLGESSNKTYADKEKDEINKMLPHLKNILEKYYLYP